MPLGSWLDYQKAYIAGKASLDFQQGNRNENMTKGFLDGTGFRKHRIYDTRHYLASYDSRLRRFVEYLPSVGHGYRLRHPIARERSS